MKYFIVADVHGHYDEMIAALAEAGFDRDNPQHCFISLGDLLDRGRQPTECLNYVLSLDLDRSILIRGNHEDLMDEMIARGWFASHDVHNGTIITAMDLLGIENPDEADRAIIDMRGLDLWKQYSWRLRNFYETQHGIFVHGWVPSYSRYLASEKGLFPDAHICRDWRSSDNETWSEARWLNGMEYWKNGARIEGKTIFCGHFHTSWARANIDHTSEEWPHDISAYRTWENDGIVALDACTAYSKIVNCYIFEDEPLED